MSNETERLEAEQELKQMEQQLTQEKEKLDAAKAAQDYALSPEPIVEPSSEAKPVDETTVTSQPSEVSEEKPKDDPMEWAKRKGYKSPEDMARELLKKDQDYHRSREKERQVAPQQPIQPQWQPEPQGFQPGFGFQPQPNFAPQQPGRVSPRDFAQYYPQLSPDDVERVLPMVLDAAEAISKRQITAFQQQWGQQFGQIQRTTDRNNELMTLMQDPAFRDERVQREVHAVLDSDPSIFQRQGAYTFAYEKALANMTRKQLQQGVATENPIEQRPPVTAGGGNGSAFTGPAKISEKDFDRWSLKDQEAFINSNGRVFPKK